MASPIRPDNTSFWISVGQKGGVRTPRLCPRQQRRQSGGGLTLSVFDGGQLLVHGLVCGFGKRFGGGAITVMHQVGGDHPGRTGDKRDSSVSSCRHV